MASINAKGHHHEWQSKPPDGKLEWSKTWDERYWDEEELAANFMFSIPEEISRLKNLLKQDPGFENSSSWPHLTEWCSTCTATRSMKLVLPEEEAKVPSWDHFQLKILKHDYCIPFLLLNKLDCV